MKKTPYVFAYEQNIAWAPLTQKDSEGRAWIKILGKDPETFARAALIKYEEGFRSKRALSTVYSDTVFLSGRLKYGDKACKRGTYIYRPSGVEYGPIEAVEETTRFVITGGRGDRCSKEPIFVDDIDGDSLPWQPALGGARLGKTLRADKEARTILVYQLTMKPITHYSDESIVHHGDEECFVIEGESVDYLGDIECFVKWGPGTYLYRPPNNRHGNSVLYGNPNKFLVKFYDVDVASVHMPPFDLVKGIPPPSFEE